MNLLSDLPKECNVNMVNSGVSEDFNLKQLREEKFYQFFCNLLKEIELAYCLGPCLNPDQITKLECKIKQNVNLLKKYE